MRRNQEARRDERRSKEARVGRRENTTLLVHHTAHRQNFVYLEHPPSFYPILCLRLFLSFVDPVPSHLPRVEQRTLGPFRRGEVAQHAIDPPPPVEIRKRRRVGDHMPHRGHTSGISPPPLHSMCGGCRTSICDATVVVIGRQPREEGVPLHNLPPAAVPGDDHAPQLRVPAKR